MASTVFVSYAKEDSSAAGEIARRLERAGYEVWWDVEIPVGSSWAEVIESRLRSATCVIVLWSRHSVRSDWVKREARLARRRGVLLPVLIDDAEVPFEFEDLQAANLTLDPSEAWQRLLDGVAQLSGGGIKSAGDDSRPRAGEVFPGTESTAARAAPTLWERLARPPRRAWWIGLLLAAVGSGYLAWPLLKPTSTYLPDRWCWDMTRLASLFPFDTLAVVDAHPDAGFPFWNADSLRQIADSLYEWRLTDLGQARPINPSAPADPGLASAFEALLSMSRLLADSLKGRQTIAITFFPSDAVPEIGMHIGDRSLSYAMTNVPRRLVTWDRTQTPFSSLWAMRVDGTFVADSAAGAWWPLRLFAKAEFNPLEWGRYRFKVAVDSTILSGEVLSTTNINPIDIKYYSSWRAAVQTLCDTNRE